MSESDEESTPAVDSPSKLHVPNFCFAQPTEQQYQGRTIGAQKRRCRNAHQYVRQVTVAGRAGCRQAIKQFSHRLSDRASPALVEVKDAKALAHEIELLKKGQLALTRQVGATGVESVKAWGKSFEEEIKPVLAKTRVFSDRMRDVRRTVMVVDDDAFVQQLIGRALGTDAYELLFANDGAAAMCMLRRARPDVILMDVRLPGQDGVSLTLQLKAASPRPASIPILMLTGDARRETLVSSIEAGAAGFIVKPFTRDALIEKITKAMSLGQ